MENTSKIIYPNLWRVTTLSTALNAKLSHFLSTSLGSPFQCLITLFSEEMLPDIQPNPPWHILRLSCGLSLSHSLSLAAWQKRLTPTLLHPPLKGLRKVIRSPLSIPFPGLNSPSSFSCCSNGFTFCTLQLYWSSLHTLQHLNDFV